MYSLKEVADAIGGELEGDPSLRLKAVRTLGDAQRGDLAILWDAQLSSQLQECRASAVVVRQDLAVAERAVIRVEDPKRALIQAICLLHPSGRQSPGIDRTATVSPKAQVNESAYIGSGAVICERCRVGPGVEIFPNVYLGPESEVGKDSRLYPNVIIYPQTRIGERVRIHAGTVIGSDGFGYIEDASGRFVKVPQIGRVEIGDDVEIGANCAIDRATLGTTRIGSGTKIDNLVQIGHNSEIGRHCCLVAQVGISGSVHLGDHCLLSGQVGILDHVTLEDGVRVGAKSGVMRDLRSGEYLGYPAIPTPRARQVYPALARLPELRRQVRALEKRCQRLARSSFQKTPKSGRNVLIEMGLGRIYEW